MTSCRQKIFFLIISLLLTQKGWASQMGKIISDHTEIHQFPNEKSAVVHVLNKDTEVKVSTQSLSDPFGISWHKIELPGEGYGFVPSNSIQTYSLKREMVSLGISAGEITAANAQDTSSNEHLRGLLLGGVRMDTQALEFGGEAEFTISLKLSNETKSLNRMLAVGLAYIFFSGRGSFGGVSIVFSPYTNTRTEFEVRFRLGSTLDVPSMQGSTHLAINYPFTMTNAAHLSGYLEAAVMATQGVRVIYTWGAAGIGIHF